jgi:hypothetical protein
MQTICQWRCHRPPVWRHEELTPPRQLRVPLAAPGGHMGLDLHPLAAAGNDREHGAPRRNNPHVVQQLGHVFLSGRPAGKIPGQHEFRLEGGAARLKRRLLSCKWAHADASWFNYREVSPQSVRSLILAARIAPTSVAGGIGNKILIESKYDSFFSRGQRQYCPHLCFQAPRCEPKQRHNRLP